MQADVHFSWLREFVIPVLFILVGAALGFVTSQLRDERKAKRAKESFLRAIGMELDSLHVQFVGSIEMVRRTIGEISSGNRIDSTFAMKWRTTVFTAQIGKLRDLSDPLLIEIVHFYSDLGILDPIIEKANDTNAKFNRPDVPSGASGSYKTSMVVTLKALEKSLLDLDKRDTELRVKLPPEK
jgi:hypothetical protein